MTPLVRCTIAYMVGLSIPFYVAPQVAALTTMDGLPLAAACCVIVLLVRMAFATGSGSSPGARSLSQRRGPGPAVLFVVLGVIAGGAARNRSDRDCRSLFAHNASVVFAGQPASLPGSDGGFALSLVSARGGSVRGCSGFVRAKLPLGVNPGFIDGSAITGTGTWMAFQPSTRLPVLPERRGLLLLHAVTRAPATVPTSHMLKARTHAQLVLRATLAQYGLAEALVLAQREGVDRSVNDAFVATGMSHLLSISGTHVGLVAALLLGFAAFLRLGGNIGRVGATVGVVAYVVFLGAPAAAARSAIQVVLLLAGRIFQRPSDPYSVLAAAALSLLVVQPLNLLDAGFQLSFAGVIGLIAYRGRIAKRLPHAWPKWLRDGLAASLAASGVTLPIAAMQFGQFAPIGIAASIVDVPLVGLAIPAVALVLVTAGISPSLAHFFASGADLLLLLVWRVADVAMRVPGGHMAVTTTGLMVTLAAIACAIAGWAWLRESYAMSRRAPPRRYDRGAMRSSLSVRWRIAAVGAGAVALVAWSPALLAMHDRGTLEIHAIDVGQGDAIALRTPHGHWILIDAGPRDAKFDAGRSRVLPYLYRHGVHRLDLLVLSHPHADHIGGAASVIAAMLPEAVVDPTTAYFEGQYTQTMRVAQRMGVPWLKARDGRHLDIDGVRIDFLYPASVSLDGTTDANDLSDALQVHYGRFSALFMGDAPTATEDRIVAEYGDRLRSAVLKVGHHGSYTASGESFLNVVQPGVGLISVGRDNRYGHPNPDVLARLVRHGVHVLRTDQQGAIVVRGRATGEYSLATQR